MEFNTLTCITVIEFVSFTGFDLKKKKYTTIIMYSRALALIKKSKSGNARQTFEYYNQNRILHFSSTLIRKHYKYCKILKPVHT